MSPRRVRFRRCAALALATVAVSAAAHLAGCRRGSESRAPSASTAAAPRAAASGTLVAAALGDIENVNDALAQSSFSQEILGRLFLRLAEEQPSVGRRVPEFRPQAAESWTMSPDGRELTFVLRPGLRWSDGAPLTAADVVFTWRAQTSPEVAWAGRDIKQAIASVDALDARTVRFRFKSDDPFALMDANDGFILPAHRWQRIPFSEWDGHDWRADLVTSGPFTMAAADWVPQQSLTLRRNAAHPAALGGPPRLDRAVFRVLPDQTAQIGQLLAGEVQVVDGVTPADATRVATSPRTKLIEVADRQYTYIGWNLRHPLLADAELRRALGLAIDRREIVAALWQGRARVSHGPLPSNLWGADPTLPEPRHDPAAAREILARLGWADADGDGIRERRGRRLRFTLVTNGGNQVRQDAAALAAAHLKRVGVELVVEMRDMKALVAELRQGKFDAYLLAWRLGTKCDLTPYWHSASIGTESNFIGYARPEVDRWLEEARSLPPEQAMAPLAAAQRAIVADDPYVFLYEPRRLVGVSRRVEGAEPNALSTYFHLERWSLR